MKLLRVTCCLFVLLLSLVAFAFVAVHPCTGYLEYPFGKSQCKSDRACLHWLQKDMQPR